MKRIVTIVCFCTLFLSCNVSKKIVYLQDATIDIPVEISSHAVITIQPKDQLSIIISSKDPQLAVLFNLPRISYSANNGSVYNGNNDISAYTVDDKGTIDFPILGEIQVKNLTKHQLAKEIKDKLIKENLLKDPVVTIEFINFHISVIGEVNTPGRFTIEKDQINLLEAIALAGDLTIYGQRDGVFVIREEEGYRNTHQIDLRFVENLYTSPVYYLKQNDIIYVKPNHVRAGQSTVNDNGLKSVSLWISIASFLTTLGILIFN